MGKYKTLGTGFDKTFRNDLNANFNDIDNDIKSEISRATQSEKNIQAQVNTLVINGDSSPAAAQASVDAKGVNKGNLKQRLDDDYNEVSSLLAQNEADIGDKTTLPSWLQDSLREVSKKHDDYLRQISVNVKQPPFNAKGNGVDYDYEAIWEAIQYCNENRRPLFAPNGVYLIGGMFDFTLLPFVLTEATDHTHRTTIIGESMEGTVFLGANGLTKMFAYSDTVNLRSFTFKNLSVWSKDPYDDRQTRAPLKAFELLGSPYSVFENISMNGLDFGIHLNRAWFTKMKNISINRSRKGILIDGTNGVADHCLLEDIKVGGWVNEYGLKIIGSKASKIINFNSESGYTGTAIHLQGCHGIEVDTYYIENYIDGVPITLEGNPTLNSVSDFCTDIVFKNGHVYNLQTRFIYFGKGIDGVQVSKTRFSFDYDKILSGGIPIKNQRKDLIGFSMTVGYGFGRYFKNISILDNEFYDVANAEATTRLGCSTSFIHNGKSFLASTNNAFYTPEFKKGTRVIPTDNALNYDYFEVIEEGSFGLIGEGVTATINSGDNVALFSSVTDIIPGTYINIGSLQRLKVLAVNPTTKQVALGTTASSTVTNGVVTNCAPTLKYSYKPV